MDQLGGEAGLRALVQRFIETAAKDLIIGFLFENRDLNRIVQHEYEMAARHFGATIPYTGSPLDQVHQRLRINRGQFRRRLAILRTVLTESGVDAEIIEDWVSHNQKLEPLITTGEDCTPQA